MHVKIFMASAGNYLEQELLKSMGTGIELVFGQLTASVTESDHVSVDRCRTNYPSFHVEYVWDELYTNCDVAVIYGSWKPREKSHHVVRTSVATSAMRFVVIETALLNRRTDKENSHWRVGVNGYLSRDARWAVLAKDEAEDRLKSMGIESWQGWKNDAKGHILLGLQIPGDASLRGIDIYEWAYDVIQDMRSVTDRKITVRNHPLVSDKAIDGFYRLVGRITLAGFKNIEYSHGAVKSIDKDLKNAWCSVVYSSGMAVDSVLAGVPVICGDSGNFAWPISSRSVKQVENVRLAKKETVDTWLRELSTCQWSRTEMESGTCFSSLVPVLERI
jgi:hypothetical protein